MTFESLDLIAHDAARTVGARSVAVLLVQRCGRAHLGGAWGSAGAVPRALGGRADWRERADDLAHGTLTTLPLEIEGRTVGALEVLRPGQGPWPDADLERLRRCAAEAARALPTSRLVERRRRQLAEIQQLARALREENHEQANRVHAIAALTAMGDAHEARRFTAELMEIDDDRPGAAFDELGDEALSGFLMAESAAAGRRGTLVEVGPRSRWTGAASGVSDSTLLSLAGSLLEYSFEGIVDVPPSRRRVVFTVDNGDSDVVLQSHDFGDHDDPDPVVEPVSEFLLRDAVRSAGATLTIDVVPVGTLATVRIPTWAPARTEPIRRPTPW